MRLVQGCAPASRRAKGSIEFLSVAAPAYNEAGGIVGVVEGWLEYLEQSPAIGRFEIVVCDDGSRDDTGVLLEAMADHHPQVVAVHHRKNEGAAAALRTAIQHTRGDWILLLDSDGQFPIENLPALVKAVERDASQAAIGARRVKRSGLFARLGSRASGAVCNWIHGSSYRDFNSACKLVYGPLLRSLKLEAKGLNYSTEITSLLAERGVRMAETEIVHRPRTAGTSHMSVLRGGVDRLLFIAYIGFRHFLQRMRVLQLD